MNVSALSPREPHPLPHLILVLFSSRVAIRINIVVAPVAIAGLIDWMYSWIIGQVCLISPLLLNQMLAYFSFLALVSYMETISSALVHTVLVTSITPHATKAVLAAEPNGLVSQRRDNWEVDLLVLAKMMLLLASPVGCMT